MSGGAESEVGFEEIYSRAGNDLEAIPWASLAPHPELVAWLARLPEAAGQNALVIGCGLGDDAEAVSGRGYQATAFDIAPSAITRCRQRFPHSTVDYQVADLFSLPSAWRGTFDLVVEVRTLQSLPVEQRAGAARAIAAMVRPGGLLWVRCLARGDGEAVTTRPWPISRRELGAFADAGLRELVFAEESPAADRGRSFTVVFQRD